jgi:CheY-like chemotaxis protein
MKLLLIEDDENKQTQIAVFLSANLPAVALAYARSYQTALKRLLAEEFDVVLLDMTIPTFDVTDVDDGGRPQAYGGREVLRQMDRRGILTPVFVVTQFDRFGEHRNALTLEQLDMALRGEHPRIYRGAVHYDSSLEAWKHELGTYLATFIRENTK